MTQPKPEYKVVKVDGDPPVKTPAPAPAPEGGAKHKKHKSMRTFPRGIMKKTFKVRPTADPAKPPAFKKSMRRHTIRLYTERGETKRRKTIKRKVSKMTDKQVDEMIRKHDLLKNESTPAKIKRDMLSGAMLAGFISAE